MNEDTGLKKNTEPQQTGNEGTVGIDEKEKSPRGASEVVSTAVEKFSTYAKYLVRAFQYLLSSLSFTSFLRGLRSTSKAVSSFLRPGTLLLSFVLLVSFSLLRLVLPLSFDQLLLGAYQRALTQIVSPVVLFVGRIVPQLLLTVLLLGVPLVLLYIVYQIIEQIKLNSKLQKKSNERYALVRKLR